jgi:hypothetical protein
MVKRIVNTDQWNDPWFRKLPGRYKLAWKFICETSDQCGVIKVDTEYWQFLLGIPDMKWDQFFPHIAERTVKLKNGNIWIPQVVREQYGPLSEACRAHKPVLEFLRKEGLIDHPEVLLAKPEFKDATLVADTLSKPIVNPLQRVRREVKPRKVFERPTVEQIAEYCSERRNGLNAQAIFDHYEACGWVQGKGRKPIQDWKACVRTWENTERASGSGVKETVTSMRDQIAKASEDLRRSEPKRQPLLGKATA